ncbi:MAG: c-type cytochrome biogenesis protein CcmI [Betaproteobacteria bacterium]|nr:c-type cytochrome biogenesis protein CcmI [Betaproteobacteria bacterium]
MTGFIIAGGLLVVAALGFLLWPLLRGRKDGTVEAASVRELNLAVLREQRRELDRDEAAGVLSAEEAAKARAELDRRVLEDVGRSEAGTPEGGGKGFSPALIGGVVVAVLASVAGLYALLGEPDAMSGKAPATAAQGDAHSVSAEQIAAMVERLAERLQQNPNDATGWLMLARSYAVLGRYPESVAAYGRSVAMMPADAQTLADFADVMGMANNRSLQGEPEKVIRQALQIDPNNIKALALSGTIFYDRQDYAGAIGEWRKILALVPPDSPAAQGINNSIRDAENRMGIAPAPAMQPLASAAPAAQPAAAAPAADARVAGTVELAPALAKQVAAGDTVYVFARAVNGPKMPLAMMRSTVSALPLKFSLDDSQSMAPNIKLSQHSQVIVGARVSKSGDAIARSGDFEGFSTPVPLGAGSVKVVIAEIVK